MPAIPSVCARYPAALIAELERRQIPTDRILRQVRLSRRVLQAADEDSAVPLHQATALYALVAAETEVWDASLMALRLVPRHPELRARLGAAPTVARGLEIFVRQVLTVTFGEVRFGLTVEGDRAILHRLGEPRHAPRTDQRRQHELVVIGVTLRAMHALIEPAWQPDEMWSTIDEPVGAPEHAGMTAMGVMWAQPFTGVVFPRCLLAASTETIRPPAPTDDLLSSLRRLLATHCGLQRLTVEHLAEIAGLSARTLQRRLQARGLSFRQLVDEVRYQEAIRCLRDPEVPIGEIVGRVGYSDKSHFIRAFRRMADMTPSSYREHCVGGRRAA